jgi:hypothetical protein
VDDGSITGGMTGGILGTVPACVYAASCSIPGFRRLAGCFGVAEPDCIDQPDPSPRVRKSGLAWLWGAEIGLMGDQKEVRKFRR